MKPIKWWAPILFPYTNMTREPNWVFDVTHLIITKKLKKKL